MVEKLSIVTLSTINRMINC